MAHSHIMKMIKMQEDRDYLRAQRLNDLYCLDLATKEERTESLEKKKKPSAAASTFRRTVSICMRKSANHRRGRRLFE